MWVFLEKNQLFNVRNTKTIHSMTLSGCTRDYVSMRYQSKKQKEERKRKVTLTAKRGENLKYFCYYNWTGHNFRQLFMLIYKYKAYILIDLFLQSSGILNASNSILLCD